MSIFAPAISNQQSYKKNSQIDNKKGLVAQLNSALDYGSRGYWFESSRGHKKIPFLTKWDFFLIFKTHGFNSKNGFIFKPLENRYSLWNRKYIREET